LQRRLGKPQCQPGHFGEDYLAPTRIQTPNCPSHIIVIVTKATQKHNRAKYGVTKMLYHLTVKAKPDENTAADNTSSGQYSKNVRTTNTYGIVVSLLALEVSADFQ
jgi:hypothetical protein